MPEVVHKVAEVEVAAPGRAQPGSLWRGVAACEVLDDCRPYVGDERDRAVPIAGWCLRPRSRRPRSFGLRAAPYTAASVLWNRISTGVPIPVDPVGPVSRQLALKRPESTWGRLRDRSATDTGFARPQPWFPVTFPAVRSWEAAAAQPQSRVYAGQMAFVEPPVMCSIRTSATHLSRHRRHRLGGDARACQRRAWS
jgi:hypothetical protein